MFAGGSLNNIWYFSCLQFYSFDSAAVAAILNPDESLFNASTGQYALEFPFSVTELEHEIINLPQKQSFLLLGRSGTGKTTCLVFRMWCAFKKYWTEATPEARRGLAVSDDINDYNKLFSAVDGEEEQDEAVVADDSSETRSGDMVHLHTVFLTRNPVLRDEVRKCFNAMRKCDDDVPRLPVMITLSGSMTITGFVMESKSTPIHEALPWNGLLRARQTQFREGFQAAIEESLGDATSAQ